MTDAERHRLTLAALHQLDEVLQQHPNCPTAQADLDTVRGILARLASDAREGEPNAR